MSRNGIDPSGFGSSDVNWIFWVYTIYVLEKLFFSYRVLDDTGVIHIPLPHFGRILGSVDGFHFKVFHEEVSHYGADGRPHGCSTNLFIETALELEICCLQANLNMVL